MIELRDEQPARGTAQALPHDLRGVQPGEDEEARADAQNDTRLHEALARLRKRFEAHAFALEKRCFTRNACLHWQMRGRQQILRAVAGHLREMSAKPWTAYALFVVLKDYIRCLEKYAVDAEEGKNAPISGQAWPIQQWKARGVACEVPSILAALRRLLSSCVPAHLEHILALNGSDLMPLAEEDEDVPATEHQARVSIASGLDEESESGCAS